MTTEMNTNELDSRYAGHGVGTAGLTLGIIGTALAGLGGGVGLLNGLGKGGQSAPQPGPGPFITREEFALNSQLAARDAQIADLKAEMKDEKKMTEVYAVLATKINEVNDKVAANRDRSDDRLACAVEKLNGKIDCNKNSQDAINYQQGVLNATNAGIINCLQSQIAAVVTPVVKNSAICPGWGSISITPTTLSA